MVKPFAQGERIRLGIRERADSYDEEIRARQEAQTLIFTDMTEKEIVNEVME